MSRKTSGKSPKSPKIEEEYIKMFGETIERGAALSAVALLDSAMEQCLRKIMIKDEDAIDQMFNEQGSLGNLGSKIRFSFLFGIIKKDTYKELLLINKIRNEFTHRLHADGFSFPKIQGLVSSLMISQKPSSLVRYIEFHKKTKYKMSHEKIWEGVKDIMIKDNIDVTKPKWAFVAEVGLISIAFIAAASYDNLMKSNHPLLF